MLLLLIDVSILSVLEIENQISTISIKNRNNLSKTMDLLKIDLIDEIEKKDVIEISINGNACVDDIKLI